MIQSKKSTACPATATLTLLNKKHMLILLNTLTQGESFGFNDLQNKLSINTASLSRRLHDLEEAGLAEKRICQKDSRCHYYTLTKRGDEISKLLQRIT